MRKGKAVDAAYIISKLPLVPSTSELRGCTDFNTLLHGNSSLKKSKIAYLPVIDASPTDMSTVNTILVKSLKYADDLSLHHIVLVFDQGIYCKAQQMR